MIKYDQLAVTVKFSHQTYKHRTISEGEIQAYLITLENSNSEFFGYFVPFCPVGDGTLR